MVGYDDRVRLQVSGKDSAHTTDLITKCALRYSERPKA